MPFQALTLQSALGGFLELGIEMTPYQEEMHKKLMPYAISLGTNSRIVNAFWWFLLHQTFA